MLDRLAGTASGIISIGIAGALAVGLPVGQWVVADAVLDDGESLPTDPAWTGRLAARLPEAARGVLLGVNAMVAEAMQKASLHSTTGAVAVDMESHIVARVARRHRLPFAAARVISDAAHHDLPPAVWVGMKSDGEMDLPAVLRSLLANPGQLPALIRTGLEAERGFRALLRGHRRLGPRLGGPDLA
jgi:hopanoid-associated phosphorylase